MYEVYANHSFYCHADNDKALRKLWKWLEKRGYEVYAIKVW